MRVIYMSTFSTGISAVSFTSSGKGAVESVATDASDIWEFSAVTDPNYTTHVVYDSTMDTWVGYSYRLASSSQWNDTLASQPFAGSDPTLTIDTSTSDIYVLAIYNSSIIMRSKAPGHGWSDRPAIYPVTMRVNPRYLGSNYASVSRGNSSQISMIWTEGNGPFNASFASFPIQTVWSPYGYPPDPWDGNGVVPYGQYFANLGEYVSPSTGMLTVEQTDLSVAGRGLSLDFTRVYTEPNSFFNENPLNYEIYPWAPLGDGWQLNLPWLTNSTNPSFIHLWSGEGYRIPPTFWGPLTSTFENHQGEHFILSLNSTGLYLDTKSGTVYTFDPSHLNRPVKIIDTSGNSIIFGYDSRNRINCVTDTVGRSFQLSYLNNLLSGISQVTGTCSNPQSTVRSISFSYTGSSLSSVSDPAGRKTLFQYNAVGDPNIAPWLISKITYPTGWYTNYAYASVLMGTQATSYRTFTQTVSSAPSATTIRKFQYNYTSSPGDQIIGATVRGYNGTQLASYTDYAFSPAGMTMNVSDANHVLVRGHQQRFGMHGEIPKEITIVAYTNQFGTTLGSFTDSSTYDSWGNQIYSVDKSGHERFSAYYNDGLPFGFYAFADTFSQNQGTAPDNVWNSYNGTWLVQSGRYNGTWNGGLEKSTFAWANIGKANISFQAQTYLQENAVLGGGMELPRFGIFGHYSTGSYKWALAIHLGDDLKYYLELLDEPPLSDPNLLDGWLGYTQSTARSSCPAIASALGGSLLTSGVWYTFNMTIHSMNATGWLSIPGQSQCRVTGNFSPSSPAASGTGFGLYPGGYSVLFDNLTVADVNPSIISPVFSDSFISGGAPNSFVHGAAAGTAEFQNGPGSVPIETYYSYWNWGGLNVEEHRLDSSPNVVKWLSSSRTYDTFGNPSSSTDFRGNTTSYSYSPTYNSAYLTSVTQTLKPGSIQITSSFGYSFTVGTRIWSYDPNLDNTTSKYDILGRPVNVTYLNSARYNLGFEAYHYNDTYNFVDITNGNGWKTRQIYDGLGRFSTTDRFLNGKSYSNETRTYDLQNSVQSMIDPIGRQANYTYDAIGRLTKTAKPDGNTTSAVYDDPDLMSWAFDESGVSKEYFYDFMGRLIAMGEHSLGSPLNYAISRYYYDQVGNLLQVIDPDSYLTVYNYDNLNRLTYLSHQDTPGEYYTYDYAGNLITRTDERNLKTLYSYDSLNRVSTITYCGMPITSSSYIYDKNGNLLQLQNQNATVYYAYDGRNRTTNETYVVNAATRQVVDLGCSGGGGTSTTSGGTSKTYKILYGYDREVQTSITYTTTSRTVNYAYDSLGRVSNASSSGTYYGKLSYFQNDQVKSLIYGNGLTANYTYDKMERPLNVTVRNGNSKLMSLLYAYNRTGTVLSVRGQVNSVSATEVYKYDPISRLTNATFNLGGANTTLWYSYDASGNRLKQSVNGALTSYSYDSRNELTSSSTPGTSITYRYDPDGNLANRTITSGGTTTWTYTWDSAGRLLKVSNGTPQGSYAYDAQGRRVESVESSTIFYSYLGTDTLSETPSSGTETDYVHVGGMVTAKITGTTVYYYHLDVLGSTRLVTDASKTIKFADNYKPFGEDNGTPYCPVTCEKYKFTGKPVSQTTGLYYEYRRWYDSSTGRLISADPAPGQLSNPQTLNTYVYAVDRPTSVVDPTGLDSCNLWNPFTYGGCVNNGIQAVNNVVVQPAENFVNNRIVKPIVNNVVKPFINNVVVPLLNNVVIPLIIDYIAANNYVNNGLSQAGQYLYNGAQATSKAIHDLSNSPDRLTKGLVDCGAIVGVAAALVAGFYYGGPAVSDVDIVILLRAGGVALPSTFALDFYPGFDHVVHAAGDVVRDFAGGCASAIVG